jgi:voltage-gated potassium channel
MTSISTLVRRRHRGYRQLLLVCTALLAGFALPAEVGRITGLLYNLLPPILLRTLGHPFGSVPFGPLARRCYRVLGVATLASNLLWSLLPLHLQGAGLSLLVLWSGFSGWSTLRLVRGLGQERRVNDDVLMGALAGYLLMGLSAALTFSALERLTPGSFSSSHSAAGQPLDFLRLTTFAFVSLTTTGYGDVVPVSAPAQVASVVVSIAGTCYLAVVMALLISRYTVQEHSSNHDPDDP